MKADERTLRFSAYFDGELDASDASEAEAALRGDPALAKDLEAFGRIGRVLRSDLLEVADGLDYGPMEDHVLAAVRTEVKKRQARPWAALISLLRSLFGRPVVAFALGALVAAGGWVLLDRMLPEAPVPDGAGEVARGAVQPELRAPEGMVSYAKAAPSLVLEALNVERGSVVLDSRPDDPEAPVVLWYLGGSEESPDREGRTADPGVGPGQGEPL